jgi:23S rRNA (pseudouridine1915-N3)-methyltransferase
VKLVLLCVGKLRNAELRSVCDEYAGRLRRYGPFEIQECKAASAAKPAEGATEESKRLLGALSGAEVVWVLDERGRQETSPAWAARLSQLENRSVRNLTVVLGGAYGLSDDVRRRGEVLALSRLTFPHELCRAIVLEQLYRARTIQRGEPYHH